MIEVDDEELLPQKVWRFIVAARAGGRCERCGEVGEYAIRGGKATVEAHHVNHDGTDHRLANGQAVCIGCHVEEHAEARKRVGRMLRERRQADPAWRAAAAEKSRKLWADPEWRARNLAAREARKAA